MPKHLHELYQTARVSPAVNQFEYHIGLHDEELLQLCKERNITVTVSQVAAEEGLAVPSLGCFPAERRCGAGRRMRRWPWARC